MSGGSLDYAYSKVEQAIEDIIEVLEKYPEEKSELRYRFVKHLRLVADALKALEWNLSGDGDDQEDVLIKRACPDSVSGTESQRMLARLR